MNTKDGNLTHDTQPSIHLLHKSLNMMCEIKHHELDFNLMPGIKTQHDNLDFHFCVVFTCGLPSYCNKTEHVSL